MARRVAEDNLRRRRMAEAIAKRHHPASGPSSSEPDGRRGATSSRRVREEHLAARRDLAHQDLMALLRAIVVGNVVRGSGGGGDTRMAAPHVLHGEIVNRFDLRRLADLGLIFCPMSGPPTPTPAGIREAHQGRLSPP